MKIASWRNAALVLAVICCYQRWNSCTHAASRSTAPAARDGHPDLPSPSSEAPDLPGAITHPPELEAKAKARTFYGIKIPPWLTRLAPQPGESMRAYRDRVLPLAQLAIAPQRARVARTRDDFGPLDAHQRAELDGAVQEAATAIQDRVMAAIASGELRPSTFKPMAGIAITRELLDIVDRGNTRFVTSLTAEQRTRLASNRFDFADYLLFSAHWEDALHILD